MSGISGLLAGARGIRCGQGLRGDGVEWDGVCYAELDYRLKKPKNLVTTVLCTCKFTHQPPNRAKPYKLRLVPIFCGMLNERILYVAIARIISWTTLV